MKLHGDYENGVLRIHQRPYFDEGWIIRYDDAKPTKRWEVLEVPLCAEERLYKCFDSLDEAIAATEELT